MKTSRLKHPISKALGLSCKYSDPRQDGSAMMTYYQPYTRHPLTETEVMTRLDIAGIPVQYVTMYRGYIKVRTIPGGVA